MIIYLKEFFTIILNSNFDNDNLDNIDYNDNNSNDDFKELRCPFCVSILQITKGGPETKTPVSEHSKL